MSAVLSRSPFTDAVLDALRTLGKPVGDGRVPPGANWMGGVNTPGSVFVPYVVLSEIVASHSSGPFADSQADWQLPYLVESYGVSREACSWMAGEALRVLEALRTHRFTVDGADYGVQQIRYDSLGAPVRVEGVSPSLWHAPAGVTIWIGKGA